MQIFEQNSNIFKLLTEAISEGIIIVDASQNIVATNNAANIMFGYDDDELSGKPLNLLIPKNYRPSHGSHFNKFMSESSKRQMGHGRELYGRRKDESIFPVEAGLNPFKINGEQYVMALVIDITVRKGQQQEILNLNNQLEKKIEIRTEELNKTVEELKEEVKLRREAETKAQESLKKERELNDLKTKFLSLVSHEFKTPLSGILTSTSLIGKYELTEQQSKRDKHLKTIKNKVKYLDNILNDFLSIERLESGKVTYKYNIFPLSKVINEVVYDANMLLKQGQQISYPKDIEDLNLEFDEKILELILSNLISNAIKYSPEETNIDLQVVRNGEKITIILKDEGIGIPPEEQKFVFKRYFRAENALTSQGTGIGLNIARTHLKNLGGELKFESTLNQGSTFYIELPNKIIK